MQGLIPRAIAHLFREIKNRTDSAITVRVSYVELYPKQNKQEFPN